MIKSVRGKIWQQAQVNENRVIELRRNLEISDFLAQILSTRTANTQEAFEFLNPKIKDSLPDPFHLLDMDKAVERTILAIIQKHKICIFADYDVDGATSSALLKNIFRDLGYNVDIYVPDRIIEGYGPTPQAMQKIKGSGTDLLITVDCGTMAVEALKHASNIGLDVIVIDHHISCDALPPAIAIINPNRLDETSKYRYLAAVGVSFLFATALISKLKNQNYFKDNIQIPNLMGYLDLVALGTVCDVMMLTGLNRVFVAQGLKVISRRENIGLNALFDIAGLDEKPSCYHLGFVIGPRVNAGGRVGKSNLGATLLSTLDDNTAIRIAAELNQHNDERKIIEAMILEEAFAIAETQKDDNMLFVIGQGWHVGVIGIIAARLKDKYNKPTAVIAVNDKVAKASCRSIKGIDFGLKIIEAKNNNLISSGGGHAMAAGFTTAEELLAPLHDYLNNLFAKDFEKFASDCVHIYSFQLTTESINPELMSEISKLEPYGNGNSEPLFKFSNLFVLKADIVGEKHIKCLFASERNSYGAKPISAIAFNAIATEIGRTLLDRKPNSLSVIGTLKLNNWQGIERIQLQVIDIIIEKDLKFA